MSKSKINTREKILAKALEMFNENGVEYVGLRELAALLDMRVSNITYYFPTKDDLVGELALELAKSNSAILVADDQITMLSFLQMLDRASRNQLKYSGLLLSMVHLLQQNKAMLVKNRKSQADRNVILKTNLDTLIHSGYLKMEDEKAKEYLVYTIGLLARFWISESAISFRQLTPDEQRKVYLSMIVHLLLPYASKKGRQQIDQFLSS